MSWMHKMIMGGLFLRSPDDPGGGGPPPTPPAPKEKPDPRDEQISLLTKRLEALEGKAKPPTPDDPDLLKKAEEARKAKEKTGEESKRLEAAIKFNLQAKDWAKANAALLPKDLDGIFVEAEKEKYDSAVEKDSAIKSSLVQSFFNIQANLDLLTSSQKSTIEDFLKLTKNGKQEKAQQIYDSIFEPTFEMLKRLEKAKQLRLDGHANSNDADLAYKEKMMKASRKHYTGEKENAGRN